MLVWPRMEKISWVDKMTNVEVFQKVEENRTILNTAQQWKLRWIIHILRHESLLRAIIEGRILCKATRVRLEKVALDGSVECCAPPPRWCDLEL